MSKPGQKDNSTLRWKVQLRRNLLREIERPVVLEAFGGYGHIWEMCYRDVAEGVVLEKDPVKADVLARQRPTWAVYECETVRALSAGVGRHLPINFVDFDPYGDPWPAIEALFGSRREWPDKLALAVNDGLRQKLEIGAWDVASMAGVVSRYGNRGVCEHYLAVCRELLEAKAGQVGYTLTRWTGYYCGHAQQMTHYAAVFVR